jgi:hypothetical protein
MTHRETTLLLPGEAEQLLANWPSADPGATFWDHFSTTVEARLSVTRIGSTRDDLLAPPLPESAEDADAPVRRSRPELIGARNLAELARARVAQSKEETQEMAKASLSLSSRTRDEVPRLAQAMRARSESRPPPTAAASEVPAPRARSRRSVVAFGGISAVALAAAAAFFVTRPGSAPVEVAGPSTLAALAPVEAASAARAADVAQQPAPDAPTAANHQPAGAAEAAPRPLERPAGNSGRPLAAAAPVVAKRAAASETATPTAAAPRGTDDLPPNPQLAPAHGEQRASKPATGAVMAAVAGVMGGARACVAGHPSPSKATVVFGSDGRVRAVNVSGPAAGTPAEGCIKSALSGARVQPFAEEAFSIGVAVRP